ncbi:phosphatase PAP2 family protein [Streptomyces sp. SCSIO 75703]|uniref:phosphatase PAP2 family protein n=1 Tax=unclassified Streptomyces TaxID=2593676 RepID=UPI000A6BAC77|nr:MULTISPECIES: phosphatase PAP2 family protein [unclassified Streptomyces]
MTFEDNDLYRDITGFAHDTPVWVQRTAEAWTEAGLLVFGVLFVIFWWRARHADSRAFAIAALAPVATAVAYVCSELLKSVITEERPCRAVPDALPSLITCPPTGDWSFPSNHSTIAGGAAVTLVLVRRALVWLTAPMALLMAFSRVFVGVHYPHDVAAGLLFGVLLAFLAVRVGTRPVARLTETMRASSSSAARWLTGPGPTAAARPRQHAAHARR